ncbi:MAG: DUF3881 family protein [Lachnospiraceae bacterium]|nr:DUF3881 family protein [Lachnospiraceae bacterium]
MHLYLRTIGFSDIKTEEQMNKLTRSMLRKAMEMDLVESVDVAEERYAEITCYVSEHLGITFMGTLSRTGKFQLSYEFPFLRSENYIHVNDFSVQRHSGNQSYAVVSDDVKPGVNMIFYLQNVMDHYRFVQNPMRNPNGSGLRIAGLSLGGMILLPVYKDPQAVLQTQKDSNYRDSMVTAAKSGDEEALENLTLEDLDVYAKMSRRVHQEDIYSIIDTTFMPYGVECDQYAVIGEILDYTYEENEITKETICIMSLLCNDVLIDVAVNTKDFVGEPAVGRRYKGTIWALANVTY